MTRKQGNAAAPEEANTDPMPGMVTRIFDRVRQIKRAHPDLSRTIDTNEAEIRDRLMRIKDVIDEFPHQERELLTVLVINGVHKMCDEILIDDADDTPDV